MTVTVMSPENMNSKSPPKYTNVQDVLSSALLLTEVGVDLRGCYVSGNKCINQLRNIVNGTEKAIKALQTTSKCALEQAYKMVSTINKNKPSKESEELIAIIQKQLNELEQNVGNKERIIDNQKSDKASRLLEGKQKSIDNIAWSGSNKNLKNDIDEKYPGSISRESLIDLNTVVNLPPVPEDIFTSFVTTKPTRSSSLSSLKSMRKVKMFLQRAETSDDDESSELEEHDLLKSPHSKLTMGDNKDDIMISHSKKILLGNITEETKFDE